MGTFAFCTITHGDKYLKLGDTIINQITELGHTFYVLSNDPARYADNKNVVVIPHTYPYFSFHQKRIVVGECLKRFDAAVFLDADVFLNNPSVVNLFSNVDPGLHIFATFGHVGLTFLNDDINKAEKAYYRNTKYGRAGKELLDKLGFKYKKDYHNIGTEDYIEHFLEGKWILKKDGGKEQVFLNHWDKMVELCEKMDLELGFTQSVGAGEGGVMSIAAFNSGIKINRDGRLSREIHSSFISNYQEKLDGTKPWNIAG